MFSKHCNKPVHMVRNKKSPISMFRWNGQKAKLKVMFPRLTEVDLDYDFNHRTDMFYRLEFKLGLTSKELQDIMVK